MEVNTRTCNNKNNKKGETTRSDISSALPAMSDREGHSGLPPTDDDLSLPKATVAKMITGSFSLSAPSAGL